MKKFLIGLTCLCLANISLAKNLVITSIQPIYSIVSILTEGTDIEVKSVFGSDVSMDMAKDSLEEGDIDLSFSKDAQAVVNISRVWSTDSIFEKVRALNINAIEIDASYPFDSKKSTLFFRNNIDGSIDHYIWLSPKNILKMSNIIASDFYRIYPKNKDQINKNLLKLNSEIVRLEEYANKKLLETEFSEVITLSENLSYLLNDLNIYTEYLDYKNINSENISKILDEKGIKIIVSDRWLKKDVIKAIGEAGGKFIVLDTLNIPMDLDDKMDPEAIIKFFENNVEELIEALN